MHQKDAAVFAELLTAWIQELSKAAEFTSTGGSVSALDLQRNVHVELHRFLASFSFYLPPQIENDTTVEVRQSIQKDAFML